MGQYVDTEVKSAVGRADVVIKMQDAIYVLEFKMDGTAEEALAQINSKGYAIQGKIQGFPSLNHAQRTLHKSCFRA